MNSGKTVICPLLVTLTLLAVALMWFYFVHEELPKFARAPTSLALVAIVDSLWYAIGISGIYGKQIPVFGVN